MAPRTKPRKSRSRAPEPAYIELKQRLEEAESVLRAIRGGEVDALVLRTSHGEQVFTLSGADKPYRLLVERMKEGAATLNGSGTITYANNYLAEMLQARPEQLLNASIFPFVVAERAAELRRAVSYGKKRTFRGEYALQSLSGSIVPAYLSLSPAELEGAPGVCLLVTDLREQKQLEHSRSELERQKIEREMREKFVSVLSHDLRTPLTAARARLELLGRQPGERDLPRQLAKAIGDIDRADRMLRDFLDVGRVRAGQRLPFNVVECDLRKIVEETLAEMTLVRGKEFVLRAPPSVTGFWSPEELRRAIENLVVNAIKYGSSTEPVTVILEQRAEVVQISVHNEGSPIPPGDRERIFTDYARSQAVSAGHKTSWGLGLVLVRGVAEAHGGSVWVESAPGRGTTFTIRIPTDTREFMPQAA